MRIWPSFLVYGNWGGPGWSGGEWVFDPSKTNWGVPPVDDMDALFKAHDFDMQNGIPKLHTRLYENLLDIDSPKTLWGKLYRYGAIASFCIMSKLE